MFTNALFALLIISARADIVGGEEVLDSDPVRESTVGLYTPSPDARGGSLCTASLIGKDMAVTAAHCIPTRGPKPVVLFGRDLHSSGTIARPVVATRVNPTWKKMRGQGMDQGDIALVRFRGGIPAGYHKIGMARSDAGLIRDREAVLAGYGISDAHARSGSGVLRKTRVRIVDGRRGKPEMIFDQSRGHGACHGDSGGPAMVSENGRPVLVGVTNRSHPGYAPDDCGHQVVYTKVSAYRNWIQKTGRSLHQQRTLKHHEKRLGRPVRQTAHSFSGRTRRAQRRG